MVMKEKEILQEIIQWLNNDTSYLSTRTDYARGYKDGIERTSLLVKPEGCRKALRGDSPREAVGKVRFRHRCVKVAWHQLCHRKAVSERQNQAAQERLAVVLRE